MTHEGPLGGFLAPGLLENAGITRLRKRHFDEAPTFSPVHHTGVGQTRAAKSLVQRRKPEVFFNLLQG